MATMARHLFFWLWLCRYNGTNQVLCSINVLGDGRSVGVRSRFGVRSHFGVNCGKGSSGNEPLLRPLGRGGNCFRDHHLRLCLDGVSNIVRTGSKGRGTSWSRAVAVARSARKPDDWGGADRARIFDVRGNGNRSVLAVSSEALR